MSTLASINNEFCQAAYLDKKHDPWLVKRKSEMNLATVMIVECSHESWWYKEFIGIECMVELRFCVIGTRKILRDCNVVLLNNSKMNHGRSLAPEDVILI